MRHNGAARIPSNFALHSSLGFGCFQIVSAGLSPPLRQQSCYVLCLRGMGQCGRTSPDAGRGFLPAGGYSQL